MHYTASRFSDGNKIFPASITTEEVGLKVKVPGFWKDEETFVTYTDISGVSVDTPLVGYSSIEFNVMGSRVKAHGFTKGDVREIKEAIDKGKSRGSTINSSSSTSYDVPTGANASGGDSITIVNKGDGFLAAGVKGMFGILEKDYEGMSNNNKKTALKLDEVIEMTFSTDANEISNQLNQLVSLGSSTQNKPLKNAIVEKLEFGIMKLRGLNASGEANYFEKKLEPLKKKSWF